MSNPTAETDRRMHVLDHQIQWLAPHSDILILVGSLAYGANHSVSASSDIDLICVPKNPFAILNELISDPVELSNLKHRIFDGYALRYMKEDVEISLHMILEDTFNVIAKCNIHDIRLYRPSGKPGFYMLRNFAGENYKFEVKNIPLNDIKGQRTIVPVSFIQNDRYYLGIHRDKLLSCPNILIDRNAIAATGVEEIWRIVCQNLESERCRFPDQKHMLRFENILAKWEAFSPACRDRIARKIDLVLKSLCIS